MRKLICLLLCLVLILTCASVVFADANEPEITLQPQSPNYPNYSYATYTVKAEGKNLSATWYLKWEGKTYNLSDTSNGMEPWEVYAGESYGPTQEGKNTFTYFFSGIEEDLNGATIWCVIEDGHDDVTSQKAYVSIGNSYDPPVILSIPAKLTVKKGEDAEIRCVAQSPGDTLLEFVWYETASGKLEDIQAIDRGTETSDFLFCDTSKTGTRYYVCMVQTSEGGMAYSSVVEVEVEKEAPAPKPTDPPETQPPVVETEPPAMEEPILDTTAAEVETVPATEAPTQAPQPDVPVTYPQPAPQEDEGGGVPWWVLVLIALVGCGAGIGVAVILINKNKH